MTNRERRDKRIRVIRNVCGMSPGTPLYVWAETGLPVDGRYGQTPDSSGR